MMCLRWGRVSTKHKRGKKSAHGGQAARRQKKTLPEMPEQIPQTCTLLSQTCVLCDESTSVATVIPVKYVKAEDFCVEHSGKTLRKI